MNFAKCFNVQRINYAVQTFKGWHFRREMGESGVWESSNLEALYNMLDGFKKALEEEFPTEAANDFFEDSGAVYLKQALDRMSEFLSSDYGTYVDVMAIAYYIQYEFEQVIEYAKDLDNLGL